MSDPDCTLLESQIAALLKDESDALAGPSAFI